MRVHTSGQRPPGQIQSSVDFCNLVNKVLLEHILHSSFSILSMDAFMRYKGRVE